LSALIAIPYVAIIIGVSHGLGAQFPMWGYFLMLVILALALQPAWQKIQNRVDRLFYRERYDYLRALEQFGQQIKSITDLDSLAFSTLDIVSNAMQVRNACLMMPSPQTGDYRVVASRGLQGISIQHKLERSSPLIRWMEGTSSFLKSREIEIIPQLQALSRNEREVLHDLKGELYISLKVLDKLVGIFILGQKYSQQLFIKEDLQLLSAVSSPLATSLENARLYQLERQRASEIAALQESLSRLTTELDMKLLLQKVTEEVAKLLQATAAAFFATEENSRSLVLKAAIGLTTSYPQEMKLALVSMIPREFLDDFKQRNAVVTISDVAASSIRKSEFLVKEDIRSILEIPVVRSGELVGVIAVFSQHIPRQFSQEEVNMAQAFTYHAASAMENARLYNIEREQRIQLEELDKLRSEFLLGVSHELKTPLTSIKSASELILDDASNPDDPRSQLLSIIKHNTERMEKRIQELLDFVKMRSSTLSLQRKAEDINRSIEEVTAINAPTLWLRKQTLKTKLLHSTTMVMLDRYRFDQIMTNLLSNASKYSPQGSEIEVGMRVANSQENSHIIIDVCDRGSGVPQEEKELIFEPYYRGKKATVSGLGIGLSIVKSLVELHGGKIWVSDRDGGGSVFSFSLPMEREQAQIK
jgi:signal transduction histidine kinase